MTMRLSALRAYVSLLGGVACLLAPQANAVRPLSPPSVRACLAFESDGRLTQTGQAVLDRAMHFIGNRRIWSIEGIVSTPGAGAIERPAPNYVPSGSVIEFTMSQFRALDTQIESIVRERRPRHWSIGALPGNIVPGHGVCETLIIFKLSYDSALCSSERCDFTCTHLGCESPK